ncbi:MAG: M14 family zinc carboxypeptidase [Planctomycetota bacterium]
MNLYAILSAAALAAAPASALTLDGDFDHGSLESFTVSGSNDPVVNLVGRDNFYGGGQWRWLNFKVDGALGLNPLFSISDNFAGGGSRLNNHQMVYSYDGETWEFFEQNIRIGGQYNFRNLSPFTQDEVQVAYSIPYSYDMSVQHSREVLGSPWAAPTSSAVVGPDGFLFGVIGESPGGVDDLGRTVAPRDIFAYRITNPNTDSPTEAKRKVVITTGMHAGEVLGTHTYQGMVDWLISDDPRAAALRNTTEFYAYPTMNPDGRFAGNSRATVENPNQDPNGLWNPSLWIGHEDIQVNGEAMIADVNSTPGGVDAFIDFHSSIPAFGDDFGFIEIDQGDNQADWWRTLVDELQPNIIEVDSTSTGWTSANFGEAFLGAEVDVTFETEFGLNRPLEYYHQLGANFGIAFFEDFVGELALAGDYNGDGLVDAADYTVWADNFGSLAELDADGNYDGVVNAADYTIWADNFGLSSGLSSAEIATQFAAIPEPSVGVALLSLLGVSMRRRGWAG